MTRETHRLIWAAMLTIALLPALGCSGTSGYSQSAEELTPRVDIISGDNQIAPVNTVFGTAMKVRFHKNGMALGGHPITFVGPDAGASGWFPGALVSVTVTTDPSGYAVAPAFTANGIAGSYPLYAWNTNYRATFHLTNQ